MFDFKFAINSFPKILSVAPTTIILSVIATIIGLILAILIVIIRERKIKVFDSIAAVYVSFIRGTPIIVQLYVVYYGLPQLLVALRSMGINTKTNGLPVMLIAILAYSFNASANISESIRSAYHSVDYQQYEAAVTVGMKPTRAMTRIVIPQLITNFIPNFSNLFLDLVKDTAIVYNIGIVEIMAKANILSALGFKYIETYLDALIIYVSICWIFAKLFQIFEVVARKYISHTQELI
ncbi:putative amino-acid permease protein YxeN [Lentilactobacillus sunkii]|jgi:His/Glu/Gln/Arg/opine family amino acid ABC transporter permease subunit|uniref:Putative amino-acid permease protein YxeN n=1 Tax=Lentilactobacillus sunkii TaxID=481719 RepID=A0A1E7XHM2_9LACO|nr:amino acid ABC transporter permease [Lentilactobacillus sunkii]OFA12577.1 putative amino-acid permease protein YxeN [Lentilactobacillus sunkii]